MHQGTPASPGRTSPAAQPGHGGSSSSVPRRRVDSTPGGTSSLGVRRSPAGALGAPWDSAEGPGVPAERGRDRPLCDLSLLSGLLRVSQTGSRDLSSEGRQPLLPGSVTAPFLPGDLAPDQSGPSKRLGRGGGHIELGGWPSALSWAVGLWRVPWEQVEVLCHPRMLPQSSRRARALHCRPLGMSAGPSGPHRAAPQDGRSAGRHVPRPGG